MLGLGLKDGTRVFYLPRQSGCSALGIFYLQKPRHFISTPCAIEDKSPWAHPPLSQRSCIPSSLPQPRPSSFLPHQKRMAYEKSADLFDIARSMFKYPWLEYPGRTKGEPGMDRNRIRVRVLKRKAPWLLVPGRGLGEFSKSMGGLRAGPWTLWWPSG